MEACENIAHYPHHRRNCHDVVSHHQNAVDFELPTGNIVAFFFNPFAGEELGLVAERIEESCRAIPRKMLVVFVNPTGKALFPVRPAFRKVVPPLAARLKLMLLGTIPVEFYRVEPR